MVDGSKIEAFFFLSRDILNFQSYLNKTIYTYPKISGGIIVAKHYSILRRNEVYLIGIEVYFVGNEV